jgi:hypothetical protein
VYTSVDPARHSGELLGELNRLQSPVAAKP